MACMARSLADSEINASHQLEMSSSCVLEYRMSIQENWLANLKALVDELAPGPNDRGVKRPAFREIADKARMNEEYLYQLYNGKGKEKIGFDKARAIARAFANGRDLSWFDQPASGAAGVDRSIRLSDLAFEAGRLLDDLDADQRKLAYSHMAHVHFLVKQGLTVNITGSVSLAELPPKQERQAGE